MKDLQIRQQVYEKMEQEYNIFLENLKQKSPEEIVNGAYEKVIKEELVAMFCPESEQYDISKIRALNKTNKPLEELYQGWMDCDAGIHQVLEDNIYDTLDDLVQEQKQKNKDRER